MMMISRNPLKLLDRIHTAILIMFLIMMAAGAVFIYNYNVLLGIGMFVAGITGSVYWAAKGPINPNRRKE